MTRPRLDPRMIIHPLHLIGVLFWLSCGEERPQPEQPPVKSTSDTPSDPVIVSCSLGYDDWGWTNREEQVIAKIRVSDRSQPPALFRYSTGPGASKTEVALTYALSPATGELEYAAKLTFKSPGKVLGECSTKDASGTEIAPEKRKTTSQLMYLGEGDARSAIEGALKDVNAAYTKDSEIATTGASIRVDFLVTSVLGLPAKGAIDYRGETDLSVSTIGLIDTGYQSLFISEIGNETPLNAMDLRSKTLAFMKKL
ncbi:MAG: hypothetical protein HYT87_11410 [Nitrospirae bacterium]|nr:hypothetical protein [Nitrospirota bacterium]